MTQQTHKCGLYFRVSTEQQAGVKEGSLVNQEEKLNAYINNKRIISGDEASWIIVKKYKEEGRSAKDIVNRPKFLEMKGDIKNGLINTVVFTDISRLSRSTRDFLEFIDFLKKHESNFICVSHDGIDTSSDFGKAIFTILTALMEFELATVRKRGKDAYHARRGRGNWMGGYLYGYDLGTETGALIVNEQEAKVVRFIFSQYLKEPSIYTVANRCNQMGYRTKEYTAKKSVKRHHPSRPFSYSSIHQMLVNLAYIGKIKLSDGKIIKTEKWEPIIKEDIFNKVQALMEKNLKCRGSTPSSAKNNYEYLLTELLRCFHCNSPMTTSGSRKKGVHHPYYVHRRDKRNLECSLPVNIPADKLDEAIWKKLALLVEQHLDEPVMKGVFSSHMQKEPEEIIAIRNQADEIKKAIQKQRAEHDDILRGLGKNIQSAGSRVPEVLKGYSDNIEELKRQLQENEENLKHLEQKNSVDSQIGNILQHKHKNLNALPFQKRKEVAQIFLNQIVLKEDHVMLEMKSIADPVIGLLKKRLGFRSHPYSYLDIEWL